MVAFSGFHADHPSPGAGQPFARSDALVGADEDAASAGSASCPGGATGAAFPSRGGSASSCRCPSCSAGFCTHKNADGATCAGVPTRRARVVQIAFPVGDHDASTRGVFLAGSGSSCSTGCRAFFFAQHGLLASLRVGPMRGNAWERAGRIATVLGFG